MSQPGARPRLPGTLLAIAHRDLLKLARDRPRLAVNLAFPILLVAGLGNVLQPTVGRVTGLDAVPLAFTGVLAATLFQSTAAGMISLAEDRETDFARELFVAPIPRAWLLGGKVLGEATVALAQGAVVVAAATLIGVPLDASQLARMAPVALACCVLGGAFGLATVAALPNQRSAMQVFQFLIIPQYLLAGVIVPLHALPRYLDVIVAAMPLRYLVDLNRAAYYDHSSGYGLVAGAGPACDAIIVTAVTVLFAAAAVTVFTRREETR